VATIVNGATAEAVGLTAVAQSQSGKWVSKVAATGGGRTYKSQRPTNFYLAVFLIVVVGLTSVFFARNSYQSGVAATSTTAASAATFYSAQAFDVCGTLQPSLPASSSTLATPVSALASGVVKVLPKATPTVAQFATGYSGVTVTSKHLVLPAIAGLTEKVDLTNGQKCPAGTPDAGKAGQVVISYWKNFAAKNATSSSDPSAVRYSQNSLVTVAFVPSGAKVQRPSQTTVSAMLIAAQTPTTSPTVVPTTARTTTPTTAPTTTTTKK